MSKVNIIVMGKTGAGKSTLINALLGEHRAKTGTGSAQTMKNEIYHTWKGGRQLELLDTVGLELNSTLNRQTLASIEEQIQELSCEYMYNVSNLNEVFMVWYCINPNNNRFENFEANFIKSMRMEYEIPFMVVLTQCWDSDQADEMKRSIRESFPGLPIESVLAESYKVGRVTIDSYGVDRLYQQAVQKFNEYKINVLDDKLKQAEHKKTVGEDKINRCIRRAKNYISERANKAFKIGCVPLFSTVAMQSQVSGMYKDVSSAFGIKLNDDAIAGILAIWTVGVLTLPITIIPGLAGSLAKHMVTDLGEEFLDAVVSVVRNSTEYDLNDNTLMIERLKDELRRRESK